MQHRMSAVTPTVLGALVLLALSGVLLLSSDNAVQAQASPSAAVSLSPSSAVEQGTAIAVTMSFSNLVADTDTSTTDYIFRADVLNSENEDADGCEGGGMGRDRYFYKVDEDPETRGGTVSADCPAGDYTVRVTLSSADNTELDSATANFTIAEPAQEPAQEPTESVAVQLSSDSVEEGEAITATMTFRNLEADSDTSDVDYIFRADVLDDEDGDADACEGPGMGRDRNFNKVDEDPETRTGSTSADCPPGVYTLRASVSSPDNTELVSVSVGFGVLEETAIVVVPPTLTALSLTHGDPAVDVALSPAFDGATLKYDAEVGDVERITITAAAAAAIAYRDANGAALADADTVAGGHQVDLHAGGNTVKLAVSNGGLTATYTVKVLRLVASRQQGGQAYVSAKISNENKTVTMRWKDVDGGCAPTNMYHLNAATATGNWQTLNSVGTTGLPPFETSYANPTAFTNGARFAISCHSATVDGVASLPGRVLGTVTLYTTGASAPDAPGNLDLSTGAGEITVGWDAPTNAFKSMLIRYEVQWKSGSEDYDASRQKITELPPATSVILGRSPDARLAAGTEFAVRVRAVTVTHDGAWVESTASTPSDDATLKSLTVTNAVDDTDVTLTPTFSGDVGDYTLSVPVSRVRVSYETNEADATAFFGDLNFGIGDEFHYGSGAGSFEYNELVVGLNVIQAKVVAPDGETIKNYFLRITRGTIANFRSGDTHTPPKIKVFEVQGTLHLGDGKVYKVDWDLSWQFPSPDMTECLDDRETDKDESVTCSVDGYRITYAEWPTTSKAHKAPTAADLLDPEVKWTDMVIEEGEADCVWSYNHDYGGNIQSCAWTYDEHKTKPYGWSNYMVRYYRIAAFYYQSDDSSPPVWTTVEGELSNIRPYVKDE